MADELTILSMAKGLAQHSTTRQGLIAENVANADTVGYRARDVKPFAEIFENQELSGAPGPAPGFRPAATRVSHAGYDQAAPAPYAGSAYEVSRVGADSPNGNTVSLEDQMTRGADAMAHHEMALGILRKSVTLIRMAIGRP